MASGFQKPITIKDAINKIHNRKFLLPAIQRKFTWKHEQIEMLFDSIMRGYPINSFMFWEIKDDKIKSGYKFYQFITRYREFFSENNVYIDTSGVDDFQAVIDGQQRLTSLYIGLRGSYAYKMPRKWWKDEEACIPTRELYLNLIKPISKKHDSQKEFDFRFLSKADLEKYKGLSNDYYWFKAGNILELSSLDKVNDFIVSNGFNDNLYACDTLKEFFSVIHEKTLINYYLQEEQDPDKVLEIFIRTNSGGTPLSFSDLLMSIASANWKENNAREEMEKLVSEVYNIGRSSFIIDKDFILKTCLVLFSEDIRFKLKNFSYNNVRLFEENWDRVRESIKSAFILFDNLGFNDRTFRAKNAAIPIIYYIYNNNLEGAISSPIYKDKTNKKNIAKWLILTFIKSIFGGQTDTVLKKIKDELKNNKSSTFPDKILMDAFKSEPARNYSFEDDFIDDLLKSEKGSDNAYYVLHLLYSHLDFSDQNLHQDHLHPATIFTAEDKLDEYFPLEVQEVAKERKNWNGIANLQLLNGKRNESKNDKSLKEWAESEGITNKDLFLSEGISLETKDFDKFISDRKMNIKKYLKSIINGSD